MTTTEKLEALVRRAGENGWQESGMWLRAWKTAREDNEKFDLELDLSVPTFIFNHDFARALFGDKVLQNPVPIDRTLGAYRTEDTYLDEEEQLIKLKPLLLAWQYHLQQAVISDDPIDYMYKAVFGE